MLNHTTKTTSVTKHSPSYETQTLPNDYYFDNQISDNVGSVPKLNSICECEIVIKITLPQISPSTILIIGSVILVGVGLLIFQKR